MAFIKYITDYITTNYDLSKENITIVFPNKRAALQLRNNLECAINKNFWIPNILSIQQAMEEWSGLQLIDNIDVIFELIKINNSIHKNQESNNNFFGLAAQMAKDFDEIDQYDVDAESLFRNITAAKKIDDWNFDSTNTTESNYVKFFESLIKYYNGLRKTLKDNGQGYYGFITREIASYDNDILIKKTNNRKIIFAGFNALTKTEENIMVRLVEAGNAVMLWDLDKYYFEDTNQEAGVFAREFFKRHPKIEKKFVGDNFKQQDKTINIINVSGNSVQTNALQLQLNKEITDKTINSDTRSVVVLADESILIPTLNSIPDSIEKIRVTMGYPFLKTIIYHFIDQLFRFQNNLSSDESKIYLWTFVRFCNCEFIKLIFKGEAYELLKNWINNRIKKSTYYFSIDEIKELNGFKELFDFIKITLKKWHNTNDCICSIKELLQISIGKVGDSSNNFIKNQISVASRITNKIELLLNKFKNYIQIKDLHILFTQVAAQSVINLKGKNDGLQIMGLLETRNLDFDIIHFLSVNEGTIPLSKTNNSLIPYDLRKAFKLPTYTQQQAVYAYHFYRLLQNAKKINLYYNSLADLSGLGEPSRFIRQLEYEYANNNSNVKLHHIQYKSPKINEKRSTINIKKTPEILDKITSFSPTSIGTYVRCPLNYYFKYIEKITDNTINEEIQVDVIGKIVHKILELLYDKFGNKNISLNDYKKVCEKYFNECYTKALAENNFNNGLPDTGFNYLSKTVIYNMLTNFLTSEYKYIQECENGNLKFSIIEKEVSLKHTFKINNKDIELHGFADRIDKINNNIRILDYKTGKVHDQDVKIKDSHDEITKMPEKSIQLLVYKYLYLKNHTNVKPLDIEPGIIGLQNLSNGIFKLETSECKFFNNDFIKDFEDYFTRLIEEVLNTDIDFHQTDKDSNCRFCDFKSICKRN